MEKRRCCPAESANACQKIVAINEVKDNRNRVALQRGPLVYCFEHPDNNGKAMNIVIPDNTSFTAEFKPDLLSGVVEISSEAIVVNISDDGLSAATDKKESLGNTFLLMG